MCTGSTPSPLVSSLVLVLLSHQCACQTGEDVDRLMDDLILRSGARPYVRPTRNQLNPTVVNASMGVIMLDDFDLSNGKASIATYVVIHWVDEYLTWTPDDYGGVLYVFLPEGSYWQPKLFDLNAENSFSENRMSGIVVTFFGLITFATGNRYTSSCMIDLYNMPLDSHLCSLTIVPAGYDKRELTFGRTEVFLSHYVEHQEWQLEDLSASAADGTLMSYNETSYIQFSFTLRRRPAHMMMHTILPYFLTVTLNLFACIVPFDSGERITFNLTVFLSFVFLTADISGTLPSNSTNVTLFSVFTTIFHILNTVSVAWSVIITKIANLPANKKIPTILNNITVRIERMGVSKTEPVTKMTSDSDEARVISKVHGSGHATPCNAAMIGETYPSTIKRRNSTQDGHDIVNLAYDRTNNSSYTSVTWRRVAETINRLHFFISLLVYTVSFVVYWILVLAY